MNKNAVQLVRHGTADGPYISVREITEICYLCDMVQFADVIYEELGMQKG